jgi:hypothetical protein
MKYGSVSKPKHSTNTSVNKTTVKIDKDKISNSYRHASLILTTTKFRTVKNSRIKFIKSS